MSVSFSQIASLLICGFEGHTLPDGFRESLKRQSLAGVILFARNYESSSQLKKLTTEIAACSDGRAIIAVDQEGGRVVRFSGDFPVFPSPSYFGSRRDLNGFLDATRSTAESLREHGVNLNLTPVCDLAPEYPEHVIYSRAYSADVSIVSECVREQVRILKQVGILSCAKHFPGLASSHGDPHIQVAQSNQTLEAFRTRDYLPFRAAVQAGVDLLMPTHLRASSIDSKHIISFSRSALSNEIRGHLGFSGPVISDDLQMLGALEGIDQVEAAIRSINAGCELLIYGNLQNSPVTLIDSLEAQARLHASFAENASHAAQHVERFRSEHRENFAHA